MKEAASLKAKTVAGNIRKVRDVRNYTQDYLAAKLGISQNAYSKIELGYSKITLERLFTISTILEIEVMQLLDADSTDFIQTLTRH
ncbi:helix-turn-helix domain-containing protein [Pedobacter psychroterrae]|uniref:XRE family transcriptional regulator n=1 Tax=Pedobacter psychroterrae TaxID=2530453 RepID=A0A4R0NQK0_9SPHI|nr:helix-turn-helix transcriptional regulator [Pedobacter psychroterrae]TCD03352.1 XRE family transcriptional regulator [Pedobacter psychroterrae]